MLGPGQSLVQVTFTTRIGVENVHNLTEERRVAVSKHHDAVFDACMEFVKQHLLRFDTFEHAGVFRRTLRVWVGLDQKSSFCCLSARFHMLNPGRKLLDEATG